MIELIKIKELFHFITRQIKENKRFIKIHLSEKSNPDRELTFLRSLCHILDKGLNSIDFEKGHSRKVFSEAKKLSDKLYISYKNDLSYQWCNTILSEYEIAQETNIRKKQNNKFHLFSEQERLFFLNSIKERVSCRNFTGKKIEQEILKQIVETAIDAPTGCCRQTVHYYITQDINILTKIIPHIAGITCFSKIPCLVFVTSYVGAYDLKDINLQYIDTALSAENFVLTARAFNLFTTICNMFHATEDDIKIIKQTLKIPFNENIILAITMGYVDEIPNKPVRMSPSNILNIVNE